MKQGAPQTPISKIIPLVSGVFLLGLLLYCIHNQYKKRNDQAKRQTEQIKITLDTCKTTSCLPPVISQAREIWDHDPSKVWGTRLLIEATLTLDLLDQPAASSWHQVLTPVLTAVRRERNITVENFLLVAVALLRQEQAPPVQASIKKLIARDLIHIKAMQPKASPGLPHFIEGRIALLSGDLQTAILEFQIAKNLAPDRKLFALWLSRAHRKAQQNALARSVAIEALSGDISQRDPRILAELFRNTLQQELEGLSK